MRTRQKSSEKISELEKEFDISDSVLEETFKEFMMEQKPVKASKGMVNTATVMGLVMMVLVVVGLLQQFGLIQGGRFDFFLVTVPILGSLIILIMGMGWFANRKQRKERKKAQKEFREKMRRMAEEKQSYDTFAFKQKKKLYKSTKDKKIFGVCGGIAEFMGIDATFVRIAFVLATVSFYGSFALVYLFMALFLPTKPKLTPETN